MPSMLRQTVDVRYRSELKQEICVFLSKWRVFSWGWLKKEWQLLVIVRFLLALTFQIQHDHFWEDQIMWKSTDLISQCRYSSTKQKKKSLMSWRVDCVHLHSTRQNPANEKEKKTWKTFLDVVAQLCVLDLCIFKWLIIAKTHSNTQWY